MRDLEAFNIHSRSLILYFNFFLLDAVYAVNFIILHSSHRNIGMTFQGHSNDTNI